MAAASGTLAAATVARPPWRTIATAAARQQLTSGGGGSAIAQAVKQQLVARGTAVSAVAKQQSRGFAHFLHSPSRRGIGSNGLPRLGMDNSDRMLWSLIAANVGGWVLWRVAPNVVRARWGGSQSDGGQRSTCVSSSPGALPASALLAAVPCRPWHEYPLLLVCPPMSRRCTPMQPSALRACGRGECGRPSLPPSATKTSTTWGQT